MLDLEDDDLQYYFEITNKNGKKVGDIPNGKNKKLDDYGDLNECVLQAKSYDDRFWESQFQ